MSNKAEQSSSEVHRHITETIVVLKNAVDPAKLTSLSNKSLQEVATLQQEIAEIIPVGNVSGLVLSSLAQLKDRVVQPERARRDIEALMRGLEVVQKTLYNAAFFASPAAVLYAYQKILTLTGKDVQSAFPEGLWQFYLEISVREDTARHANETTGFQRSLAEFNLALPLFDQLTAWMATIANLYFQYDDLLYAEWSERVYLNLLEAEAEQVGRPNDTFFRKLKKKWAEQKPYRRSQDALPNETYPQYRQRRFQRFCEPRIQSLPAKHQQHLAHTFQHLAQSDALAFQNQMSILATLDPDQYRETRQPIPLWQARIAIIWRGQYHLLPACAIDDQGNVLCYDLNRTDVPPIPLAVDKHGELTHPRYGIIDVHRNGLLQAKQTQTTIGRLAPLPIQQLRYWIWAIMTGQYLSNLDMADIDLDLLKMPRNIQPKGRKRLKVDQQAQLRLLKMAPVIINWDDTVSDQPLALARLGRRGIGDHALTLFRTAETIIFDQSHIFFDGVWGLALVEILTNEAASWAAYLAGLPPLKSDKALDQPRQNVPILVSPEAAAESQAADLPAMLRLRKNLVQRSREMVFTINDLVILHRTVFNQIYQPNPALSQAVADLGQTHPKQAAAIQQLWEKLTQTNPALLIPMDAVDGSPKDRLYPISFRNPFPEFLDLFDQTYNALQNYYQSRSPDSWQKFSQRRNQLISELYYFGRLMQVHKDLAAAGESTNIATLKLLGHVPEALQSLLRKIPEKIDFLNEMLTGEEVFSNLGRVASGTSPVRFASARDDNDAKAMVWGILTDDQGVMNLSLRDFRPEVIALFELHEDELAQLMSQDFLDQYVQTLNVFVHKLNEIAAATVEETV